MAENWEGVWEVAGDDGKPVRITLKSGGIARKNRAAGGEEGSWAPEGDRARIVWTTRWITYIERVGDGYRKVSIEPTKPADAEHGHASQAIRVG